jgi:hypothetical protein
MPAAEFEVFPEPSVVVIAAQIENNTLIEIHPSQGQQSAALALFPSFKHAITRSSEKMIRGRHWHYTFFFVGIIAERAVVLPASDACDVNEGHRYRWKRGNNS